MEISFLFRRIVMENSQEPGAMCFASLQRPVGLVGFAFSAKARTYERQNGICQTGPFRWRALAPGGDSSPIDSLTKIKEEARTYATGAKHLIIKILLVIWA